MIPCRIQWILAVLLGAAAVLALIPRMAAAQSRPLFSSTPETVQLAAVTPAPSGGLRLVYGETAPSARQTTLWLANVPNLLDKQRLATINHQVGYPPTGLVSPNGKRVAIFAIPPSANERAARTDGGELWTAGLEGGQSIRLASQVGFLSAWSPDSRWIAYGRLVPLAQPANPQIPFRTELYRVSADGVTSSLLLSDQQAYGVQPLGWSADGSRFLAALYGLDGAWTIQAQDAASGKTTQTWVLPAPGLVRELSLSPDGQQVMIEAVSNGEDKLTLFHLGSGRQAQPEPATLASGPISSQQPVSPVAGVWSQGGQDVWLVQPQAQTRVLTLASRSTRAETVQAQPAGQTLLPAGWSPDERWFVWLRYPRPQSEAFLQASGHPRLIPIPLAKPENWISLFGWVGGGS